MATTAAVAARDWTGLATFGLAADLAVAATLATLALTVGWGGRVFVAIGLVLAVLALVLLPDGWAVIGRALDSAAFIAAFFTALATLRHASASSTAIARCGRFLAQQPPGRRYAALTLGGQLFALLLNYGSLVLLGNLAEANARAEPNAEIRAHRLRRMLLAVQRGFISTLPWSPFAFAVAISTTLVPGASWTEALGPCFVSGMLLASLGWGLDALFKPRLSGPRPPRRPPEGSWAAVWPLAILLGVLLVSVGGLHLATGIRATSVAMVVVPLISVIWVAAQAREAGAEPDAALPARLARYAFAELPDYRSELTLLLMAGAIGTLGASLAGLVIAALGLDLSAIPPWQILIGLVWLIPLAGQIGMNPILSVSMMGPLLPDPAMMGVTPTAVMLAITAGWAISGASSPFTATTLLIGHMGGVSATHVGLRWNGLYTLLAMLILSGWVALYAF